MPWNIEDDSAIIYGQDANLFMVVRNIEVPEIPFERELYAVFTNVKDAYDCVRKLNKEYDLVMHPYWVIRGKIGEPINWHCDSPSMRISRMDQEAWEKRHPGHNFWKVS